MLKARGLPSELKQGEGNPYIRSAYDDMPFLVALMNCDDARTNCATLQFYFGFKMGMDGQQSAWAERPSDAC